MRTTLLFIAALFAVSFADGQQTDKVGQLVSTENFFSALAKQKGIKKAFLTMSDDNTLIFRPDPIQPEKFFKNNPDDEGVLSWEPYYAKIAKSGDWGFTTGPYTFKSDSSSSTYYGQYLSIWKKNQKDVWKLALDIGVPHAKPINFSKMTFVNPANERFMHQYSAVRQKQREELVFSSDELLATTLSADNDIARQNFLANDCRLLFPGHEPIVGKADVLAFWDDQRMKVTTKPIKADRAYSGELAFTYGDASISKNGKTTAYHYVRIWEVQTGFDWNVILEIYAEASKDLTTTAVQAK